MKLVAVLALALVVPVSAFAATRKPDLQVATLNVSPATPPVGSKLATNAKVVNRGRASAKASELGYYLSRDSRLSSDDMRVMRVNVKVLKPKGSTRAVVKVSLPPYAKGTYDLLVCADDTGKVKESRETNNCNPSGRLTIG